MGAVDKHRARASWGGRVNHILCPDTVHFRALFHSPGIVVITDAANERAGVRDILEHPLADADAVLCGAARDVFGIEIGTQLLIAADWMGWFNEAEAVTLELSGVAGVVALIHHKGKYISTKLL